MSINEYSPVTGLQRTSYKVSVLRNQEEIIQLKEIWRDLSKEINTDPDFFATVVATLPEIIRPHVLKIEQDGEVVALLVARLQKTTVKARIGYLNLLKVPARAIVVVYGGLLGEHSDSVCLAILKSLRETLAAGEAELLQFSPLPIDGNLYRILNSTTHGLLKSRGEEPILHWVLALRDSLESIMALRSGKARRTIRNYQNRLERDFADVLEFRKITTADSLDLLLVEMEEIARRTYHRGLGVGFENSAEWRALLELGFTRGWLRVYVLRLKGKPAAFGFGYVYARKFLYFIPGYDPQFASYRVGRYVLLRIFEDLCADPAVDVFDYGFGDAEYKREFSTDHWREAGVTLYAATARGLALWAGVRTIEAASRRARWGLRRTGLEQWLKTLSRRALRRDRK